MADLVIKCSHCGGEIIADENAELVKCKHCRNTFPLRVSKSSENTRLQMEIDAAIAKRNSCDFDEALKILEDLLSANPNNAEIYFQLLLADYGVSYVSEDNQSIKEIPVISGVQRESIFKKQYYMKLEAILSEQPQEFSSYKQRLDKIEKLRIESLQMMEKVEPFDVFICYKRTADKFLTQDSATARKLYTKFTNWGLKVFFAEETIYNEYGGSVFEPIICSALMSAKLFILVCASPDHKEYLLAPWVKNEWLRFKKRVEVEVDNKLRLLPVFDNGFTPDLLPTILKNKFQGIKLDDEFDKNVSSILEKILSREKKSTLSQINLEQKVSSLSVNKEEINVRTFGGYHEKELSNLEKTDFTMAVADMKINSNAKFRDAYKKLSRIVETNKYNFEANLAKLKCNFRIPYEESLVNASLWRVENVSRMNEDFLDLMDVENEECENVRRAMVAMLKKSLIDNPSRFAMELKKEDNTFLAIAKTFSQQEDLFSYAEEFEKTYFDFISNRNHYQNLKDSDILTIANKIFRRIYSNFDQKGAKRIFQIYSTSFITLRDTNETKNKPLINELINLALEINPFDVDCLWNRFTFDIGCIFSQFPGSIAANMSQSNFAPFDVELEEIDAKLKKGNLYYFMLKAIQSGYKMDFTPSAEKKPNKNYFNTILNAACIMNSKPNNKKVVKQIFQFMASLTGSGSPNDKMTIRLLLKIGDRLLIGRDFKEARRYYEEVLAIDDSNCDARWGITKCDVCCPTNYSVLFYKNSLNDVASFRTLIAIRESKHSKEVDVYLPFYQAIENIKNEKGGRRRKLYNAFTYHHAELMKKAYPVDIPLDEIISAIGTNSLVTSMEEAKNSKKNKSKGAKTKPAKTRRYSGVSFSSTRNPIFLIINLVVIVFAFALPFILSLTSNLPQFWSFIIVFAIAFIWCLVISRIRISFNFRVSPLMKFIYIVASIAAFLVHTIVYLTSEDGAALFNRLTASESSHAASCIVFFVFGFGFTAIRTLVAFLKATRRYNSSLLNSTTFACQYLTTLAIIYAFIATARTALYYFNYDSFLFTLFVEEGTANFLDGFLPFTMVLFPIATMIILNVARRKRF